MENKELTYQEKVDEFKACYEHFDERQKGVVEEKHLGLIGKAKQATRDVLFEYDVVYNKAKDLILVTIEPKDMKRILELATQMGFIEAYKENPSRLRQPVNMVIKRMAKCEALGVPYKNEDGTTKDFIFNGKSFEEELKNIVVKYPDMYVGMYDDEVENVKETYFKLRDQRIEQEKKAKVIPTDKPKNEKVEFNEDLLSSLCTEFGLENDKNIMSISVEYFMENGLDEKEALVRIFSQYGKSEEEVMDAINHLEESKGRR